MAVNRRGTIAALALMKLLSLEVGHSSQLFCRSSVLGVNEVSFLG
jgi:hypothetical protein